MALKDWKKITQGKNIRYSNKNRPESVLIVREDLGDGRYFYSSGVYDTIYHRREKAFSDTTKKSEAIRFAEKYMRTH